MAFPHEFFKNNFVQGINDFNTGIVAGKFPASASFISVAPYPYFAFLIRVGTLNSELTCQVQQDTSATQTAGVKNITGAVVTVEATDDNQLFYIEVESRVMDIQNSFLYVTLNVTGAAGADDYLDIIFLGLQNKSMPVTAHANTSGVLVAG